jgi:hypothetical protein
MEATVGTDRRILRAFYTQYVAVLLIVLTFTIGAFQRCSEAPQAIEPQMTRQQIQQPSPIGAIAILGAFTGDGSVISENERLAAVVKVLENHDLRASVTLSVPRLDFDERASSLRRALRRLEALEDFFSKRAIPPGAVRFMARPSTAATDEISVRFYNEREE